MKQINKNFSAFKTLPDHLQKAVKEEVPADLYAFASVEIPDTVGDIVMIDGISTDPYHNPPKRHLKILPQHNNSALPIGRVEQFYRVETVDQSNNPCKALMFGMTWACDGDGKITEDAKKYKDLFDGGYLDSFSVGMMVMDASANDFGGYDILDSSLYEVSAVTIPANAEANVIKHIEDALGEKIIKTEQPKKKSINETVSELNTVLANLDGKVSSLPTEEKMNELHAKLDGVVQQMKSFDSLIERLDSLESTLAVMSTTLSRATDSRKDEIDAKAIKAITKGLDELNKFLDK